jgi:hypothetical protein
MYGISKVTGIKGVGLGKDKVHYGANSGYQMMNLAYLFGAKRIILLGFDMMRQGAKTHWHGDHPSPLGNECPVKMFLNNFPALAADLEKEGVEVINATRETALNCFKKMKLEDALCLK